MPPTNKKEVNIVLVKVFHDNVEVYSGDHMLFIEENQHDEEVVELVKQARIKGVAKKRFLSGEWTARTQRPEYD